MNVNRRKFLKRVGTATVAAASLSLPHIQRANATDEIRLITWESYGSEPVIADFVKKTGINVSRTFTSSNDEYMAKLAAGGGDYDVVVIVTNLAQRAIKSGFIEPLELSQLPNFKDLYPRFQTLSYYQSDGRTYGAPSFWGVNPITLNADVIPARSDFGILFDPQYKGKIAMWDDMSTLAMTAKWMGMKNVWDMTDEELDQVKAKLIEQRPLVRKYWTQAGECIELFASGEVVAATSWDYVTHELAKAGHNVRSPWFEGTTAWCDAHTIVKDTKRREAAHKFVNHMISAELQALFAKTNLYRPVTPKAREFTGDELWQKIGMADAEKTLPDAEFWDDIPRRSKYLQVWNEIKSAPAE